MSSETPIKTGTKQQENNWLKRVAFAAIAYVGSLAADDEDKSAKLLAKLIKTIINERPNLSKMNKEKI